MAVKDAKLELDLLSSILDGVEKAEQQIQENFQQNEEADYEWKLKISRHLAPELAKSLVMSIISEEEYISTVCLKLIETFLKKKNEIILDILVYKWIRYLSEESDEENNLCEYFDKEIKKSKEENKKSQEENVEGREKLLMKRFNSKLSLIQMTLNPKNDIFIMDEDFMESGLLFAVLLKKFSKMMSNPRIDNLILTEIWLEIAGLPLDRERPETFYLYAFWFQDISSKLSR